MIGMVYEDYSWPENRAYNMDNNGNDFCKGDRTDKDGYSSRESLLKDLLNIQRIAKNIDDKI
jgi:hypothetical protein